MDFARNPRSLIFGLALIGLFLLSPHDAGADCRCACVNGEAIPLCSNALEIPPICPPRICPLVPPALQPLQPLRIPPLGTSQCRMMQVLNPWTGRYEWKDICY